MRRDGHKQQQRQQQQTSEHKQLSFLLLLPYLAQSSVPRHTTHSSTAGKLRHALRMCPHALNTKRTSCARAVVKCEALRHSVKARLGLARLDFDFGLAWLVFVLGFVLASFSRLLAAFSRTSPFAWVSRVSRAARTHAKRTSWSAVSRQRRISVQSAVTVPQCKQQQQQQQERVNDIIYMSDVLVINNSNDNNNKNNNSNQNSDVSVVIPLHAVL